MPFPFVLTADRGVTAVVVESANERAGVGCQDVLLQRGVRGKALRAMGTW